MRSPTVHLICNAHLDPVWQWRWEEGCAEALSTFSTAVELLQDYPQLIFNHNESVLYRWVQSHDPGLFRQIQSLAREGRWCISGGWFLQPDVNLPGTESLIRQIVTGRRFFREHFAAEPVVAYNFDSFGHGTGLPQILRRAGYRMYIHMRPQAPDLELPGDLYRWRGLDGSEILTLRISVGLYHTERDNIEQRLQEGVELALQLNRDVPVFWGIGNHGGGPTREDLERIEAFRARERRVAIVHATTEGLYQALRQAGESAPTYDGQLQRIFTGCYTSLSRLKRRAVSSLGLLRQTESLRAATWWRLDQPYPEEELDAAWRDHLFNDFHDILTGTCIEPAEQDALDLYGRVSESARRVRLQAAAACNAGPRRRCYIPVTVLNANPGCTRVPVEVEAMIDLRPKWSGRWHLAVTTLDGHPVACQEEQPEALLPFNGWRRKVVFLADLPQLGAQHFHLHPCEGEVSYVAVAAPSAGRIDPSTGLLRSLDAGKRRECLRDAAPRMLVVADSGDAWGTDCWSYRDVVGVFDTVPESVVVAERGPIRTITQSEHRFERSRIVLQTLEYANWPVLEVRLRISWQQRRQRLKLAIPTVWPAARVLAEVPGGAVEMPADGQEHVHQRWLLITDANERSSSALAVIHDGCHGFDACAGEVRLSVLRGAAYCHERGLAIAPRPLRKVMDQGEHEVRLLLVAGEAQELRRTVTGLADWLAAPPAVYAHLPIGDAAQQRPGPATDLLQLELEPRSIRLLACRRSVDQKAIVVRLQESAGESARGRLRVIGMNEPRYLEFAPHELKTLRIQRCGACSEIEDLSHE